MTEVDTDRPPDPGSAGESADRPPSRRHLRLAGIAAGAVLAIGLTVLLSEIVRDNDRPRTNGSEAIAGPSGQPVSFERPVLSAAELEEVGGVRIESVSLSGAGGLIDLRFLVVEPSKAAAVHDVVNPPVLVDEKTGLVVNELLMGHSHTGAYRAGAKYYLIFVNPGNVVQEGSEVSVLLGNTQVEHIFVT